MLRNYNEDEYSHSGFYAFSPTMREIYENKGYSLFHKPYIRFKHRLYTDKLKDRSIPPHDSQLEWSSKSNKNIQRNMKFGNKYAHYCKLAFSSIKDVILISKRCSITI